MPFTFAHPAIILPFNKIKWTSISMSALVIGSVTPDFEYFIRMKLTGRYSHSIEGMFLMDLPIAIAISLVFHLLVKAPLIDNLPFYFRSRLIPLQQFDFLKYVAKNYYVFIGCLLVGIFSHLFWDSFTHSNEFFVNQFQMLKKTVSLSGILSMPLYRWLQHLSTTIGLIFIGLVFHRMPRQINTRSVSMLFWFMLLAISVISFSIRYFFGFEYYGDVVATAISAICIGLIGSSLVTRYLHG